MASRRPCSCLHCPHPSPSWSTRPRFTGANALLQSTTSIGIIIGPALSGLGIAFSGSHDVLCANALTYLASALCLLPIRLPGSLKSHRQSGRVAAAIRDLKEGIRYSLLSQPTILILILMASLYTFGASAFTTLFPVFGKNFSRWARWRSGISGPGWALACFWSHSLSRR